VLLSYCPRAGAYARAPCSIGSGDGVPARARACAWTGLVCRGRSEIHVWVKEASGVSEEVRAARGPGAVDLCACRDGIPQCGGRSVLSVDE
jgi:hypothetical protein